MDFLDEWESVATTSTQAEIRELATRMYWAVDDQREYRHEEWGGPSAPDHHEEEWEVVKNNSTQEEIRELAKKVLENIRNMP